jgi:hypothetical protein
MQTPVFSSPSRFRAFTHHRFDLASSLFDNRIVEVVRTLFLSSLLWLLLAGGVYAVYSLIAGTH